MVAVVVLAEVVVNGGCCCGDSGDEWQTLRLTVARC